MGLLNPKSQSGQDVFAWKQCGCKNDGTFVDIGCNHPTENNNTSFLEGRGWTGICVDIAPFNYSHRTAEFIQADATKVVPEIERFLNSKNREIDYLSMDADDASFDALARLVPFSKFKVITVEHDSYRVGPDIQNKIHEFLTHFGYVRKVKDVKAPRCDGMPWSEQPYEDWYCALSTPTP